MKIDKTLLKQEIKDDCYILLGLFLYAVGWTAFLLPNQITTGGVTGIAALIYFATGIKVAYSYFAINLILLLFSIKIFGFKFSIKTVCCVGVLTLLLSLFQSLIKEPLIKDEPFMNCILGGVVCGIGIGLVIHFRGSTGGTDIVALIINKYKDITIGKSMMICDLIIICSSYILFQSFEKIVYGLVVMGIMTYTIDMVLNGARQSVQFFIFSEKYEEIADRINKEAHRGCTIISGKGWYSKKDVKIIFVLAKKVESITIFRVVKSVDPNAFISQSSVTGVYGEGFDKMKG